MEFISRVSTCTALEGSITASDEMLAKMFGMSFVMMGAALRTSKHLSSIESLAFTRSPVTVLTMAEVIDKAVRLAYISASDFVPV